MNLPELMLTTGVQFVVHLVYACVLIVCVTIGMLQPARRIATFKIAHLFTIALLLFHAVRLLHSAPVMAENMLVGVILYLTGVLVLNNYMQSQKARN